MFGQFIYIQTMRTLIHGSIWFKTYRYFPLPRIVFGGQPNYQPIIAGFEASSRARGVDCNRVWTAAWAPPFFIYASR